MWETLAAPFRPPRDGQPGWLRRRQRRMARGCFAAGVAAAVVAVAFAVVAAAPPLAFGWRLGPATLAAGVAMSGVAAALWALRHGSALADTVRFYALTSAAGGLLIVSLVVGASSQVVIDGSAYLRTSETAVVYASASAAYDDLMWMSDASDLLYLEDSDARVRLGEFERVAVQMRTLAAEHLAAERRGGPTGEMQAVHAAVKEAATVGAQAVEQREALVVSPNPQLTVDLQASVDQFAQQVLNAGQMLGDLSARYGFRLGPTETTAPVE